MSSEGSEFVKRESEGSEEPERNRNAPNEHRDGDLDFLESPERRSGFSSDNCTDGYDGSLETESSPEPMEHHVSPLESPKKSPKISNNLADFLSDISDNPLETDSPQRSADSSSDSGNLSDSDGSSRSSSGSSQSSRRSSSDTSNDSSRTGYSRRSSSSISSSRTLSEHMDTESSPEPMEHKPGYSQTRHILNLQRLLMKTLDELSVQKQLNQSLETRLQELPEQLKTQEAQELHTKMDGLIYELNEPMRRVLRLAEFQRLEEEIFELKNLRESDARKFRNLLEVEKARVNCAEVHLQAVQVQLALTKYMCKCSESPGASPNHHDEHQERQELQEHNEQEELQEPMDLQEAEPNDSN